MSKPLIMRFGLELECTYDTQKGGTINSGAYHNSLKLTKYWNAENDGSLRIEHPGFDSVELTTNTFPKGKLKSVIEDLKEEVRSRVGYDDAEFNEYFRINYSCGHHIHFSVPGKKLLPTLHPKLYLRMRKLFWDRLKEYNEEIAESVKKNYYRSYARKFARGNGYYNRSCEFNLTNETRGLEWRSININGVKTWKDYESVVKIAIDSIYDSVKEYLSGGLYYNSKIEIEAISEQNPIIEETTQLRIEQAENENITINTNQWRNENVQY